MDVQGLRCGGCGSTELTDDWMSFDIEASAGPREFKHSIVPTITRGFLLCPACYMSPASGTLRNAVSDTYAVPAPRYDGCVTVCMKPIKDRRHRGKVRRTKARCPACWGYSWVYQIPHEITPVLSGLLTRIVR